MQKITPFLWFNDNAEEAMNFYVSTFKNSKVGMIRRYGDAGPGPKGSVMTSTFQINGYEFSTLNGGPIYKPTPATSFFVIFNSEKEISEAWAKLSEGAQILMPFNAYPFSEKFGWLNDKFGVSWQLHLVTKYPDTTPDVSTFLLFTGVDHGKAEEAISFYTSLFKNSSIERVERFKAEEPGVEGTVKHAAFTLNGVKFMAMDSNAPHAFTFSPGISLFISCETQEEVDMFWNKLGEGGKTNRCGWLDDKYGVTWQIVPTALGRLLGDPDPKKAGRVMQAMMQMEKLDIAGLERAAKE